MRRNLIISMFNILFLLLSIAFAKNGLDIHVFNVGQADSQLIVFPSGYTILVDAGEPRLKTTNCKMIAQRIYEITGKKEIDVAVLTHLHLDHVGYPGNNGFWYLLEQSGIKFKKFIDRDAGTVKDVNAVCGTEDDINWKIVGTTSSTAYKWICYATNSKVKNNIYDIREVAVPCSNQINPPDEGANVEIVISDALGTKYDGQPSSKDTRGEEHPASENDYSISLRIQYGDFVYSTAGDLDGNNEESKFGYLYHNIETPYKDVVGEVDLYHANHHGSSHSNNPEYLAVLKPSAAIISCGAGNLYGHPAENTLQTLSNHVNKFYLTQDCNPAVTDKFDKTVIVNDEIVVHYPTGGVNFYVTDKAQTFKHTYAVKTNKPKRAQCKVL